MSAAAVTFCSLGHSVPNTRQQACPHRVHSAFFGNSLGACTYRQQLSATTNTRRRLACSNAVYASAAPWANEKPARSESFGCRGGPSHYLVRGALNLAAAANLRPRLPACPPLRCSATFAACRLVLGDGSVWHGVSFGATGTTGEHRAAQPQLASAAQQHRNQRAVISVLRASGVPKPRLAQPSLTHRTQAAHARTRPTAAVPTLFARRRWPQWARWCSTRPSPATRRS
jgi:hypothetical protein